MATRHQPVAVVIMSQSHELQLHIVQMREIRSILNAMKNLALMEVHKLQRLQTMQGQVVIAIENAASDFLSFYPDLLTDNVQANNVCIVLGAERGFCGDFNDSLLAAIHKENYAGIIAIGNRLCDKLVDNERLMSALDGANVAEEIPVILNRLIDILTAAKPHDSHLTIVYHDIELNQIKQRQLFPPFASVTSAPPCYGYPPVLNLEPAVFLADLIEQYLLAVLHEVFYRSLMAENHSRLQHLDGAIKHLDDEMINLHRKSQIYRQEEITEEIEVILLNAESEFMR
jgi:F-type H+-transporting ATPase subunit gamma